MGFVPRAGSGGRESDTETPQAMPRVAGTESSLIGDVCQGWGAEGEALCGSHCHSHSGEGSSGTHRVPASL